MAEKTVNRQRHIEVTAADLPLHCPTPAMMLWDAHPRVFLPIEKTGEALKRAGDRTQDDAGQQARGQRNRERGHRHGRAYARGARGAGVAKNSTINVASLP